MITALVAILAYVRAFLIARHRLAMEAAALRQQLAVYKRKQPHPKLNRFDRLFRGSFVGSGPAGPKNHSRQARYGSLLASRRIPPVLDMAIPSAESAKAEVGGRSTRLDPPHEKRES